MFKEVLSRDPIGERDMLNQYCFVGNRPTSMTDVLGLLSFKVKGRACSGTIMVNEYSLNPGADLAGADINLEWKLDVGHYTVRGQDIPVCACYERANWIQVADADPGNWNGREGPFVDPFPNPSEKPYYYWSVSGDQIHFWDDPKLSRAKYAGAGKRVNNDFETCLVSIRAGKEDVILGCVKWGYSFSLDPTRDALKPLTYHP